MRGYSAPQTLVEAGSKLPDSCAQQKLIARSITIPTRVILDFSLF